MKGLLIKDFSLAFGNKRTLPVFVLIAVVLLVTGNEDSAPLVVSFFTMVCGMMVLSTLSYDDFDHSNAYIMTLPVTRKGYVIGKYVFTVISSLFGWISSMIVCFVVMQIKGYDVNLDIWFFQGSVSLGVLFALIVIMIPMQLKFGGDNIRLVLLGTMAVICVIGFAGAKLADVMGIDLAELGTDIVQFLGEFQLSALVAAGIIIVLCIAFISLLISIRVVEKKEF